jgi:hypothetical protein
MDTSLLMLEQQHCTEKGLSAWTMRATECFETSHRNEECVELKNSGNIMTVQSLVKIRRFVQILLLLG